MTVNVDRIDEVVALLDGCASVLFVTGAGLSADSGLPTYRGVESVEWMSENCRKPRHLTSPVPRLERSAAYVTMSIEIR